MPHEHDSQNTEHDQGLADVDPETRTYVPSSRVIVSPSLADPPPTGKTTNDDRVYRPGAQPAPERRDPPPTGKTSSDDRVYRPGAQPAPERRDPPPTGKTSTEDRSYTPPPDGAGAGGDR